MSVAVIFRLRLRQLESGENIPGRHQSPPHPSQVVLHPSPNQGRVYLCCFSSATLYPSELSFRTLVAKYVAIPPKSSPFASMIELGGVPLVGQFSASLEPGVWYFVVVAYRTVLLARSSSTSLECVAATTSVREPSACNILQQTCAVI